MVGYSKELSHFHIIVTKYPTLNLTQERFILAHSFSVWSGGLKAGTDVERGW